MKYFIWFTIRHVLVARARFFLLQRVGMFLLFVNLFTIGFYLCCMFCIAFSPIGKHWQVDRILYGRNTNNICGVCACKGNYTNTTTHGLHIVTSPFFPLFFVKIYFYLFIYIFLKAKRSLFEFQKNIWNTLYQWNTLSYHKYDRQPTLPLSILLF